MGERMYCPVCNFYSSSVLAAVREGSPCPYCQTPADLIVEVNGLRERNTEEKLVKQIQDVGVRNAELERDNAALRRFVVDVDGAMHTLLDVISIPGLWPRHGN